MDPTAGVDWSELEDEFLVGFNLDGARPALVFVRTWTTELPCHAAIARELGPDQPVVSIGVDLSPDDFPRTVAAWVDLFLDDVSGYLDPDTPILGGYSFGGVIAAEIADRLRAEGRVPQLVVLLDASLPRPKYRRDDDVVLMTLRRMVKVLEQNTSRRDRVGALGTAVARAPKFLGYRALKAMGMPVPQRLEFGFEQRSDMPFRQKAIWIAYLKYRPTTLDLRALIMFTDESLRRAGNDRCLGWGQALVGPIVTRRVPGDHFTVIDPENVGPIAEAIAEAIPQSHTSPNPG
jgi:thioesterase domain-containing protein